MNSYYKNFPGLKVAAKVYNLDMREQFAREVALDAPPDSSVRAFVLPELDGLSPTYFVSLRIESPGELMSTNFYWLSTKAETLAPTGMTVVNTRFRRGRPRKLLLISRR